MRAIIDGWSLFAEVWEMPLGGWSANLTLQDYGRVARLLLRRQRYHGTEHPDGHLAVKKTNSNVYLGPQTGWKRVN